MITVEFLLGTGRGSTVRRLLPMAEDERGEVHAPAHLDVEVAHALRRMEATGAVSPARAAQCLSLLGELPLRRHSPTALLPRMWHHRHNLTAYDAAYVALAEALEYPVVTCDERMSGAPGVTLEVWVAEPDI